MKDSLPAWETIQALRALQSIDNDIRTVAEERTLLRSRLEQLSELLARGKEDLDARRRKIADAESWYQEQLSTLKLERDKIARRKAQLAAVTKSKDYIAIQRDLEMLRQSVAEKEEELERFTEALESHKSAVAEEESKLGTLEAEAKAEEKATQKRLNEFDKRISETGEKRQEWVDKIAGDVLRRYERVKSRREGIAIVTVSPDGRCSGCHITLPPQLQNVLQRKDSLEICPSCNRYVCVEDGEKEEEEE